MRVHLRVTMTYDVYVDAPDGETAAAEIGFADADFVVEDPDGGEARSTVAGSDLHFYDVETLGVAGE